jgi:uncharacterized protein (DUF2147 family)
MKTALAMLFALTVSFVNAQSIFGKWKTIDDATGKPKSVVEIFEQNGKIYGKVVQLFREPNEEQHPICSECEDDRKGQPVMGMTIIRDMKLKDGFYQDGTICDPKNGKVYDCEFWLDEGGAKLQVRGYWGFIFRTQTWLRM